MGFQDMPEVVHRAASSKGGKVKTPKGLANVSPEKKREIQSKGGKAKYANRNNEGAKQESHNSGGNTHLVERILGNIDEEKL